MQALFFVEAMPDKYHNTLMLWPTLGSSNKDMMEYYASLHHEERNSCPTSCRCKCFLWDFISYFKYKETVFQSRQNTFEGRGGKKFVRIQPNTLLERWYPQLRSGKLKPNGCMLCGYTWKDHLEYWWYCRRRKGNRQGGRGDTSSFDRYVDNIAKESSQDKAFHRKYVDVGNANRRRYRRDKDMEIRHSYSGEVAYSVPPFDPLADRHPKGIGSVILLALARTTTLARIEDLIWLREVELEA